MALTERLAYILSVDASGAVGFDKGAVSAERLAVAQAKAEVATDRLAAAQAKAAVVEAKASGDAEKLAAANELAAAATKKLAESQAAANIAAAQGGIAKAEKDLQGLTSSGNQATSTLGRVGNLLGNLPGRAGTIGSSLPGLGAGEGAASGAVAVGGVAAAGVAAAAVSAEAGKKAVETFLALTEQVRNFQNVSGATAGDASKMSVAFRELGVDQDQAGKATFRLARNSEDNAAALSKVGIQVDHNRAGGIDLTKTFLNVADAVHAAGAGARADEIAFAAFGRQGAALLPVLLQGRDGLQQFFDQAQKHGEMFSQDEINKGYQLQIAVKDVREALKGLGAEVGSEFVPFLTALAQGSAGLADLAAHSKAARTGIADFISPAAVGLAYLAEKFHLVHNEGDAATGGIDSFTQSLADQQQEVDAAVTAVDAYGNSLHEIDSANKAIADAADAPARKIRDQAKAADEATRANEDLAAAQDRLTDAQKNVPRDLAKAREEEAAATHSVATSEDDLRVAVAKYGDQSHQAADAQDKLAEARLRASDASDKANQLEKAGARPQAVVDAERSIADAKQRQADAAEAKRKADAEDPVAEQKAAEDQLTKATQNRDTALRNIKKDVDEINAALGTQFTVQDAINGKIGEAQTKFDTARQAWDDFLKSLPKWLGGERVIDGPNLPAPPPAPAAPSATNPNDPSSGSRYANNPSAPSASTNITNNYWDIKSTDPVGAANEINWTIRSGGLN